MIKDYKEYAKFIKGIYSAEYVAVDTEASGKDVRDGQGFLMGISVAYSDRAEYLPFRHPKGYNMPVEWRDDLQHALDNAGCLIFHNAKFDLASLRTLGITVAGKFYDTMLMAHMVNENYMSKALDYLGKQLCGEEKIKDEMMQAIIKGKGWDAIPSEIIEEYACQDAALTLKLFHKLYPEFKAQGFDGELWEIEQRFVRLLISMEHNGIRVDTGLCESQANAGRTRMAECITTLGFDPGKPADLGDYLLTQLGLPVVKETPKGKPCFDKFAMEIYDGLLSESDNESAKLVREYRGWQKACAVAYEGYPKLLSPDGRLRPNYKMHGTVTGRLSCEQPNLQQIPRVSENAWDGALKQCFIAREGYELYEADYSQLELRLGASYAKERSLLAEFSKADSDVFTRMADELGFDRGTTKTLTYTLQYGGGINRLCNVFKVDPERAAEIRNNYFDTYPGFREITQKASRRAEARGYVKMWSGRRRHFQYPQTESFKAFNSVIQGGAAEIVKRSMLRLHDNGLNTEDCKMLLQVHDSVVFEIRSDLAGEFVPKIQREMEAVTPAFGVRFAVAVKKWGAKD